MESVYYKSQAQPDGGEGRSGMASRGSICSGEKAALPRQSTANAWGDVQKPSQAGLVGRVRNTWVFAFGYAPTRDQVLYPL